jgi:flagellar hook assembly protein FlgD
VIQGNIPITASRNGVAALASLALLAFMPSFLGAAFTSSEDQVMSARAAGAGGAWEAGPLSLDSALMNPAGLPTRQGSDLMFSVGDPVPGASSIGAAVLTLPVDEDMTLAGSYTALVHDGALGYTENTVSLSMALALTRWLSLGGRYNWEEIASDSPVGGANGGSLDFGLRGRVGLGERNGLIAALGVRNAVDFWSDPNWSQSIPTDLKGGLGWSWAGTTWVGGEGSWIIPSTPALPSTMLWRMGGEHRFGSGLSLRAGLSTDAAQRWSLGAGWQSRGDGPRVHYALLDSADGNLSHRIQVEWGFAARSQPTVSVAPLEIRYEAGTKRVKEAKLAVNLPEDQRAEAWQLEIRDKDGKLIRVIEGTGTPPGYVSWDGRDTSGAWVDDGDQVSYKLSIKTPDGEASSRPLLVGDLTTGAGGLTALSLDAGQQSALPALLPVFGDNGKEVDHFQIRMPNSDGPLSSWKIQIKDSQGNLIQAIDGTGPLPAELSWDGKDKQGMSISDPNSLHISLVTVDLNGRATELTGTVYSQAGLALDWGQDKEIRLALRFAPFSPGGSSYEMTMSDITLAPIPIEAEKQAELPTGIPTARPTAVPTEVPTRVPTDIPTQRPTRIPTDTPTALPTMVPTAVPTPAPSPIPTELPTVMPTPLPPPKPTPRPTEVAPYQVLSTTAHIHIVSRLGGGRMAFAFLPPPTPQPRTGPIVPLSPAVLKRLALAHEPFVVDVFQAHTSTEDPALLPRLDAAWERYRGLGFHRFRLTGLVKSGEEGGEALSRARAVRMSELLSRKGFKGEFVIWVQGEAGARKGVLIEVIR